MYTYASLGHCAIQQKSAHHCKSTTIKKFFRCGPQASSVNIPLTLLETQNWDTLPCMCLVRTCIPTRVLGGGFQGIPKFEKHVPNGFVWMGGFLCHRLNLLSTHATQLCEGLTFFIFSILSLSLLYIYTYIHKNICIDFCTFNCSAQFHIKNIMKNKCFPPLATVCQQRFTEHLLGAEHCSGC